MHLQTQQSKINTLEKSQLNAFENKAPLSLFGSKLNTFKCNQCDYAPIHAGVLRLHMKTKFKQVALPTIKTVQYTHYWRKV